MTELEDPDSDYHAWVEWVEHEYTAGRLDHDKIPLDELMKVRPEGYDA